MCAAEQEASGVEPQAQSWRTTVDHLPQTLVWPSSIAIPLLLLAKTASSPEEQIPGIVSWLTPLILCVFSYVMMALMFALYNGIAKIVGGVEFTLMDTSS